MASRKCFATLAIPVAMVLTLIPVCPGAGLEFSSPDKSVLFPRDIASGMTVPKWINGRMVSLWPELVHNDSRANVQVYDSDGRKIYEARVWPRGASRVALHDVAVSLQGDVVVVGHANDSSSPGSFFARIKPSGEVSPPIRTQPFEGLSVTFGPDGTLWILGWELNHLRSFGPDHATLRRFTLDGKLLGEFLPWSSFGCPPDRHPAAGDGAKATLLASQDRIIVLSADCEQWIELSPEGEILRRISLSGTGLLPAFFAAITADNSVYVRHLSSLSLCRLQAEPRTCEEIQGPENYSLLGSLLGADGAALVLRNRSAIEWRRPVE